MTRPDMTQCRKLLAPYRGRRMIRQELMDILGRSNDKNFGKAGGLLWELRRTGVIGDIRQDMGFLEVEITLGKPTPLNEEEAELWDHVREVERRRKRY